MTIAAYLVGGSLRILGADETLRFDDLPHISWATQEIARQAMTLGHVGLVNLLVTSAFGAWLMRPFVAAGRTALSLYVLQTIICLWVLYPPFALALLRHAGLGGDDGRVAGHRCRAVAAGQCLCSAISASRRWSGRGGRSWRAGACRS